MVLGGVILDRDFEPEFLEAVRHYRNAHHMHSELKWQKVSRGKLVEYQRFVDLLFEHKPRIRFKSIVVDTHQMNNRKYNKGDKDLGLYKMMYQLLLHSFGRLLLPNHCCVVTLDQRTTQHHTLAELAAVLNNGLKKRYGFANKRVRNIQAADSASSPMIQLADVLMGAVGYQANEDDRKQEASEAKIALAKYIAQKAGLIHLRQDTPRALGHFSIWYFQFSGK